MDGEDGAAGEPTDLGADARHGNGAAHGAAGVNMAKKIKRCCAAPRPQSVRELMEEFENSIDQSYRDARKLGATWYIEFSAPAKLVVTWPTTNAYRNGVARGLVRERHGHLRVEHKVRP